MLKNWFERIVSWLKDQRTQEELSQLSDHELADIGIYRGDIRYVSQKGRNLDFLVTWR
jgi:uncharacterized protein YjiS (DUF1127 family)